MLKNIVLINKESEDMITISVIVPIYNVPQEYLKKCIDSILNQSYRHIELLLINDNSIKFDVEDVCLGYVNSDSRVKYFKNCVNLGPSATRNKGLKSASGDFISFIDSDDWILKNTYEKCVHYIEKYELDTVFFDAVYFQNNSYNNIKRSLPSNFEFFENDLSLYENYITTSEINGPCFILYNRQYIITNEIIFPENIKIGEDVIFNSVYLQCIRHGMYLNEIFYIYRKYDLSLTNNQAEINLKDFGNSYRVKKEICDKYFVNNDNYGKILKEMNDWYAVNYFRLICYRLKNKEPIRNLIMYLDFQEFKDIVSSKSNNMFCVILKFLMRNRLFMLVKLFANLYLR